MILVVGAAGPSGRTVMRAVVARGGEVRAWTHCEEQRQQALDDGAAEVVVGDIADVAVIGRAVDGVDGVFHLAPRYRADEAALGQAMIAAAEASGVRRLAYLSALHPIASRMTHHDAKRRVEEALIGTDLEFTILQSARFMQNLAYFWPGVVSRGVLAEPFSADAKMSIVDFADVAEVAARALVDGGLERVSLQLCADGEMDRHAMASVIAEATRRPITAAAMTFEAWAAAQGGGPPSPYERDAMRRMFAYYDDHGFRGGNPLTLRAALGREPTDFPTFVSRFVKAQAARADQHRGRS